MDMPLTIRQAAQMLRSDQLTCVALTETALERAGRLDGKLGCYVTRFDEAALATAAVADRELATGCDRGPLHGIPLALKDVIAAAEGPTTAQSAILDPEWGHGKDATVVQRLRARGAVIIGKTTTMEFSVGMPEASQPFPIPRNPWDLTRWPGGSSSGTANGVAAGLFLGGLGADTGGSIRMPAAYCGITGLMPTFSLVPKSGCLPLAFSLDHIGPLARTAEDCGLILDAIAGADPTDPDTVERPSADDNCRTTSIDGLRVGVVRHPHLDGVANDVIEAFEQAIGVLECLGAEIVEVHLPLYQEIVAAWFVTASAEMGAYHRNDLASRGKDYWPTTRSVLAWGALISGQDYVQAQRVRRVGQRQVKELLSSVDAIVTPTATTGAPSYELIDSGDLFTILASIHTNYWDPLGNPVLALPIGFTHNGLPLSMQIAGRAYSESTLVAIGDAYQNLTEWHLQMPALVSNPTQI